MLWAVLDQSPIGQAHLQDTRDGNALVLWTVLYQVLWYQRGAGCQGRGGGGGATLHAARYGNRAYVRANTGAGDGAGDGAGHDVSCPYMGCGELRWVGMEGEHGLADEGRRGRR